MAVDESLCILFEDHFKFIRDEEVTRNFINFFQVNLQSYSRNKSVLCLASLVHHFRDNSIHLHLFIIRSFLKRIRLKGFFHFLSKGLPLNSRVTPVRKNPAGCLTDRSLRRRQYV